MGRLTGTATTNTAEGAQFIARPGRDKPVPRPTPTALYAIRWDHSQ
ncbi:hypothetical protein [Streptomyces carpinensis]|nr:hypothetical protein [Streptomyces carpinensis]